KIIGEMTAALAQLSPTPAGERKIKEVELDASTFSRIDALLTETQRATFHATPMSQTMMLSGFIPNEFPKKDAQAFIALGWKHAYDLDDSQLPQAMAVAQLFISAVNRYESATRTSAYATLQNET